ncbi:MAG TPA: hypothetical protein VHB25_00615 [Gemmatimonadaceae bacterium]|nr:hypothetical protein [Gemmatimonadaceae bacterium]
MITYEGIEWRVDEHDARATPGAKGPSCLVFDADTVVRRVWAFPEDWNDLSDDALGALIDVAIPSPRAAPSARTPGGGVEHEAMEIARECTARTRALLAEVAVLRDANRALRADREARIAECRRQRDQMRIAIESYASALRASGVPPERAVVLLKSAMHEGGVDLLEPDDQERDEIVREGVAWAIEAYFAA